MHGSFSRADTWNFMALAGPDFRAGFVDDAPASNADVGHTIAHLLDLPVGQTRASCSAASSAEALPGGTVPEVTSRVLTSEADETGQRTVIDLQQVGDTRYFDAAGYPGRTVGLSLGASKP